MRFIKTVFLAFALVLPMYAMAADQAVKLYKNPNCGCCEQYAEYLEDNGFEVEIIATHDLNAVKDEHNIPPLLSACHTALIDGYIVEGHVPVESVKRMLSERRMIRGITVPGMPQGSPGMSGVKQSPLEVYYISDSGEPPVYAIH